MIQKEILIELINKKISQKEIAKLFNVSQSTISHSFKKYGLKSQIQTGGAFNVKDLIGIRFGKLVVIKLDHIGQYGKEYVCKCDCGNIKVIRGSTLTSGNITGCGCSIGKSNIGKVCDKQALSRIGEKYNNLLIIGIDSSKLKLRQRSYIMICKCDCGNITKQIYADIKKGKVVSCGCHQREQASITGSNIGLNNIKHNGYDWYFLKKGIRISCRSGYEVLYANWLIKNDIEFEYEPECFTVGTGKRYTPDFYLVNTNEYIEIKGYDSKKQAKNRELFKKTHTLIVKKWNDLVLECELKYKTYSTFLRNAKKQNVKAEDFITNF